MVAVLAATPQPNNLPPRVQLVVTGLAGTNVTITRTNDNGTTYPVRTANPGLLGTAAWFDYESPYTVGGTYTAVSDTGASVSASVPPLWVTEPWLINVGIPQLSMPVTVESFGDRTRDVNQGVHVILGRQFPVARTDGVRRAPSFQLVLRTETYDAYTSMVALLADSTTLLLQINYPGATRSFYGYVSIGAVTESNKVDLFDTPYVAWTLPCTQTASPSGLLQAQWTCAGVLASYGSAAAVKVAYTTCTNLLINNPIAA